MAIRKAIVLAAGFGTRLRPLTISRPKPLLPIMGEPMLARMLDMLVSWGVDDIKVNAHHHAGQIERFVDEYCGERGRDDGRGVRISVSREDAILGTGGALRPLADWIGDEPFWLVNGDVVAEDLDPEPIEAAFEKGGRFASCWMSEDFGPRTIEADPEGRVCNWRSDDAGCAGTYTYCGVALLSPDVVRYLPPPRKADGDRGEGFCSIVEAYESAMMTDARFVVGVQEPDACWCDAGTIGAFKELNSEAMSPALFGEQRLDRLVAALGWKDGETLAEFMDARGSDRMFYRLYRDGSHSGEGSSDALAVVYELTRKENARFASITRYLESHGVKVPRLLADLPEQNAYATEFVPGSTLEQLANAKGADLVKLYLPVVKVLKSLWGIPADAPDLPSLEPAFDAGTYAWEIDFFENECVKGRYGLDAIPDDARRELERISDALVNEPASLVHRDFQSSNLLYPKGESTVPYLVDYQGLRPGAAAYDVASLLYDPYVPMEDTDRKMLTDLICREGAAPSPDAVKVAAVQRLCQVIGAFCRLGRVGQPRFERYVPKALHNLHHAVHEADMPAMAAFSHTLMEREKLCGGRH